MDKKTVYSLGYALIFLLALLAGLSGWNDLLVLLHPLVYLYLMLYLQQCAGLKGRFHKRLFKGLILSFLADILFRYAGTNTSIYFGALLSFLLAHLYFISAFYLDFKSAQELDKKGAKWAIGSSAVVFTLFYLQIRSYLGAYRLPVIAYIFIVSLLLMMALFRNQRVNTQSFRTVLAGVVFCVIADAGLLYMHFTAGISNASTWIFLLYTLALYLIIRGGVSRELVYKQTEI